MMRGPDDALVGMVLDLPTGVASLIGTVDKSLNARITGDHHVMTLSTGRHLRTLERDGVLQIHPPHKDMKQLVVRQRIVSGIRHIIRYIDGQLIQEVLDIIAFIDQGLVRVRIKNEIRMELLPDIHIGPGSLIIGTDDPVAFLLIIGIGLVHSGKHVLMAIVHNRAHQDDRFETRMSLHQLIDPVVFPHVLEKGEEHTSEHRLPRQL